jgi:hypothetical protein
MSAEIDRGRLRAALVAGKIPVSDDTIAVLAMGLRQIRDRYRLHRIAEAKASVGEVRKRLSALRGAADEMALILNADLGGLREIETLLGAFGFDGMANFAERLHCLQNATEQAWTMTRVEAEHRKTDMHRRSREPETWVFLDIHDLMAGLKGKRSGVAGPLHRFTVRCCELIGPDIVVPDLSAFKKRMSIALGKEGKNQLSKQT